MISKLETWLARSLVKSLESEEEERVSIQSEPSDKEVYSKKGSKLKNCGFLSLIVVEPIQDLIASAVKIKLGGDAHKTHLYTNLTLRGPMRSTCPVTINL